MSSASRSDTPTRYMGGQAVVEGVMMRGERTWAVAVRTPEGEIEIADGLEPAKGDRGARELQDGERAHGRSSASGRSLFRSPARERPPHADPRVVCGALRARRRRHRPPISIVPKIPCGRAIIKITRSRL